MRKSSVHAWVGAVLFSLFAMLPVLGDFSHRKFGPNLSGTGSDSYAALHLIWLYGQEPDGRLRSYDRDLLTGYPSGRPIVQPVQLGLLAQVNLGRLGVSPAFAYNVVTLFCFFAAYFVAFLIFTQLNFSVPLSHFLSFVVGLNPYQVLQAVDHTDLAFTWMLLLNIYFLIRLVIHRDPRWVPALIAITGLSIFGHPYFLVSLAILNAGPLLWIGWNVVSRKLKVSPAILGATLASLVAAAASVFIWKSMFGAQ